MAQPFTLQAADGAPSTIFKPNLHNTPFNIGIGCVVVSGTPTYRVQHTFDDPDGASPVWFTHATITGATANADGNYAFPVRGIRLEVTSGTGVVRGVMIQAGISG
jgi:hypothetical protein